MAVPHEGVLMRAGKLRERIILQVEGTPTKDADGYDTVATTTLATVWAEVREEKGSELLKAGKETGSRYATFIIRHRTDVTQKIKISYDSVTWDIESLRTIDSHKRKDHLEIFARVND